MLETARIVGEPSQLNSRFFSGRPSGDQGYHSVLGGGRAFHSFESETFTHEWSIGFNTNICINFATCEYVYDYVVIWQLRLYSKHFLL
jgi:hypothetical protein